MGQRTKLNDWRSESRIPHRIRIRIRIRIATLVRRSLAEVCTVPVLLVYELNLLVAGTLYTYAVMYQYL